MNRPVTIADGVENYYRLHARLYDHTRWAFLFGRDDILQIIDRWTRPAHILEIGCGTGRNLWKLRQLFPKARLYGLDLSSQMLGIARRRLGHDAILWHRTYHAPVGGWSDHEGFDLILAAYALSMFNPGWQQALDALYKDLSPGGHLALVDFHDTSSPWFRYWMAMNHVRMDGHLLPVLATRLTTRELELRPAYGGLWRYSLYLGDKAPASPASTPYCGV